MEKQINQNVGSTVKPESKILNATASNRVIRKVVLLDPTKIKKLGLESRIIQAVNKLKDAPTVSKRQSEDASSVGNHSSKGIEKDDVKSETPVTSEVTTGTTDNKCDINDVRLYRLKPNPTLKRQVGNLRTLSRSDNILSRFKDFNGFTDAEIAEGKTELKRLSDLIQSSSKQTPLTQIPSFKHLRTYLCHKKQNIKNLINKGERRWSCPLSSPQKAEINNSTLDSDNLKCIEPLSVASIVSNQPLNVTGYETSVIPKVEEIFIPEDGEESFCVVKEEKDEKVETISYSPSHIISPIDQKPFEFINRPIGNSHRSNKGIVILDQKIIKSGIGEIKTEVISDTEESINEPCSVNPIIDLPTGQSDRTILVKILGQDFESKDIHIEIIDPLLKMQQPPKEPIDPIKNICKSYVKKMLKSTGIKRIKINTKDKNPKKVDRIASMALRNAYDNNLGAANITINENFNIVPNVKYSSADKTSLITSPQTQPQYSDSDIPAISVESIGGYQQSSSNQYFPVSYAINQSPIQEPVTILENERIPFHETQQNTACASIDEPMDAVDFILNCTQTNNMVDNNSMFEDEDDLEEVNWGDESDDGWEAAPFDDDTEGIPENNSTPLTQIKSEHNARLDPTIVNMIEQAEITFEADIKPSYQMTVSQHVNHNVVNAEQSNINTTQNVITQHTAIMPASNDSLEFFTIKEISPSIQVANEPVLCDNDTQAVITNEEMQKEPLKKRKLTIKNYQNMNTNAISELQERIKQRMIEKTQNFGTSITTIKPKIEPQPENSIEPGNVTTIVKRNLHEKATAQNELQNEQSMDRILEQNQNTVDNLQIINATNDTGFRAEESSEKSQNIANNIQTSGTKEQLQAEENIRQPGETKQNATRGKGRRFKVTPVMRSRPRPKIEKTDNNQTNTKVSSAISAEEDMSDGSLLHTGHAKVESKENLNTHVLENPPKSPEILNTRSNELDIPIKSEYASNKTTTSSFDFVQNSESTFHPERVTISRDNVEMNENSKLVNIDEAIITSNHELYTEVVESTFHHEYSEEVTSENQEIYSEEVECDNHEENPVVIECARTDAKIDNSKDTDQLLKEQKPNRIRKPTSKAGYLSMIKKRREKINNEQPSELNAYEDQETRTNEPEANFRKSRRKNTIPEIDKLALQRRSLRQEFNDSAISSKTKPNQQMICREQNVSVTKRFENASSSLPVKKRGRPPKNRPNADAHSKTLDHSESFDISGTEISKTACELDRIAFELNKRVDGPPDTVDEPSETIDDETEHANQNMISTEQNVSVTKRSSGNTTNSFENASSSIPVKKRGRPPKNRPNADVYSKPLNHNESFYVSENEVSKSASEWDTSTFDLHKMVEEAFNNTVDESSEIIDDQTKHTDEPPKKKQKTVVHDFKINPRLVLVKSAEEIKLGEAYFVNTEDVVLDTKDTGSVRCGACKSFFTATKFKDHLKEHYGVGWIEGTDKPIDLSSYREVMNAMHAYLLNKKVGALICKACGETKKSAAGLLIHLQTCLLDEQEFKKLLVTCDFCPKKFLPPALWTHMKTCRNNPEKVFKEKEPNIEMEARRKSAVKANSSFKELIETSYKLTTNDLIKPYKPPRGGGLIFRWKREISKSGFAKCFGQNCPFQTENIDEMKNHTKNCMFILHGGYSCVRCEFYDLEKENVRKHVIEIHSKYLNAAGIPVDEKDPVDVPENSNDSSYSVSEDELKEVGHDELEARKQMNLSMFRRKPVGNKDEDTYTGMLKIYANIYTTYVLYPNFKPLHSTIVQKNIDCYRPLIEKSVKFSFMLGPLNKHVGASKAPQAWNQLKQFETEQIQDELIIFIGGPISHMAWVPQPIVNKSSSVEYLAVAYKKGYEAHRKFVDQPEENEIILVYRIERKTGKKRELKTELVYGVRCSGPIHHFVFLPSGGYAPEINRLGVMAVGTAKTSINLYSLPLKANDKDCDINFNEILYKILDIKPCLVLRVDLYQDLNKIVGCMAQCTRIVWSETTDHNIISGGFSNGFVGIWDIGENNLTNICGSEYQYRIPLCYFSAITHAVSGLSLHYAPNGPRWLSVTNHAREFQTYDLEDMTNPAVYGSMGSQKNGLSSTVWPLYSENPAFAVDEYYNDDPSFVFFRSTLNVSYKVKNIIHSPAGFKCLEFSPWYNALVGGCENGDLIVQRFRKFSMESPFSNTYPRWSIFFTDISRLDGNPIPIMNPKGLEEKDIDETVAEALDSFYPEYNNTHGLIFGGPIACDRQSKSTAVSTSRIVPTSLRPLTRINCVALNLNVASTDMIAIGYNNGLIRIKCLKYKEFL